MLSHQNPILAFRRTRIGRHLTLLLSLAVGLLAITTYIVLARSVENTLAEHKHTINTLLVVNAVLVLSLVIVVGQRVFLLWRALRLDATGSRLQTRVMTLFGLVAVLPTLVVSIFSAIFFSYGIQTWFDKRVSTALEESVAVASAYLTEHKENLRSDAISLSLQTDPILPALISNPGLLQQWLDEQTARRSLVEGMVVHRNRVVARTSLSFSLDFEQFSATAIEQAKAGEVALFLTEDERVRALVKLQRLPDTYLMVGRLVDAKVLQHMQNAEGSVAEYQRLKNNMNKLQWQFFAVFILVALLLLLAALWYGSVFASALVVPITKLVQAAERVRAGDYGTKVEVGTRDDEVSALTRAFNRMTDELDKQRQELVEASRQIDARRRFSEAVLSGVSAGVMAVDLLGHIILHNRSAQQLLKWDQSTNMLDKPITNVFPAAEVLLARVKQMPDRSAQEEVSMIIDSHPVTFLVRITAERDQDEISRFIVTFDDMTQLVHAQRNAAWSDVARRVAHEIKNPLTPIHLAAERLRKKYADQVNEADRETYVRYVDTITKHVGDIGKMVEEFVSFARMPTPVFQPEDMQMLIRKVVFSEQTAHPDISYKVTLADQTVTHMCDERQFRRAIANLLKNAAEAFEGKSVEKPTIEIISQHIDNVWQLEICDNGPGFPADKIHRLTEPYITTREKGTGLGLAIVKKIIEDHGGKMLLQNRNEGGARVLLSFVLEK